MEQEQKDTKKMNYFVEHTEEPRHWEFAPICSPKIQTAILQCMCVCVCVSVCTHALHLRKSYLSFPTTMRERERERD